MARYIWTVRVLNDSSEEIDCFTKDSIPLIYDYLKDKHPQYCEYSLSTLRKRVLERTTKHLIFETQERKPMTNTEKCRRHYQKIKKEKEEYRQILQQHNLIPAD